MKPENKFRTWFIERAEGYIRLHHPGLKCHFQKHADMVTSGIPDMSIAIGGMTMWIEVKLLTSCKKERKIDVTPIQMAHLIGLTQAGVPAGLLVGLALGPRKGYDVALYHQTIPTVAHRDDFRPWTFAIRQMAEMATNAMLDSFDRFCHNPSRAPLVGRLPVLYADTDTEVRGHIDLADEDGG